MIITHDKTVVFYKTVIRVYDTYNEASTKQKQIKQLLRETFYSTFYSKKNSSENTKGAMTMKKNVRLEKGMLMCCCMCMLKKNMHMCS